MRLDSKNQQYICGGCGLRKSAGSERMIPPTLEQTELAGEISDAPPKGEILSSVSKPSARKTSPTKRRKRVARAKRLTELRQVTRDLAARVNDIEIQMDRRLEEIQSLLVRLQKIVEDE